MSANLSSGSVAETRSGRCWRSTLWQWLQPRAQNQIGGVGAHERFCVPVQVGEVLDIVQDEADSGLSAKHVCKLLVRVVALARRREGGGLKEQRALVESPVFESLLQLAEERVLSFSAKVRPLPASDRRTRRTVYSGLAGLATNARYKR